MTTTKQMSGRMYHVRIDGQWTAQGRMFTRADMAFWGFTLLDVRPPRGYRVELDANQEPAFTVEHAIVGGGSWYSGI